MSKIIGGMSLSFLLSCYAVSSNANVLAYVTNAASPGSVLACSITHHTGQFDACENAGADALSTPLDIAFATVENTTYAYIANSSYPAVVTQCSVNDKGGLQACALTDVPSYAGISFYKSDRLYAYVSHGTSVQQCIVGTHGQLDRDDCRDSGAGNIFLNGPMYMTFQTLNNVNYAYITNGDYHVDASVIRCKVQANGSFLHCEDSGVAFNGAADVDFTIVNKNTYAYVTEPSGTIMKCHVDQTTGFFANCAETGNDFVRPIGMTFGEINNRLYAYIVDGGFHHPPVNEVKQCSVSASGDLACVDAGVGAAFANPFGIALHTIN